MTTNDEIFDALKLSASERRAMEVLISGGGGTAWNVLYRALQPVLLPLTDVRFYVAAADRLATDRRAIANPPVTVRYVNGVKRGPDGTKLCTLDDCTSKHEQHGMCSRHFQNHLRDYVPILPLALNSENALVDQNGHKICTSCQCRRSLSRGKCAACKYQESRTSAKPYSPRSKDSAE